MTIRFGKSSTGASTVLAVSMAGLLALFAGCRHATEAEESAHYPATHPLRTDTSLVREYVAQIRAIQHIEVRAMEAGYLQGIYVDEGQKVAKGQQMFQIMPTIYEAEAHRAAAEVELAQVEYENTATLASSNVVSPSELKLAKARLDKAKAELEVMQTHLRLTEIHAPFDGLMDRFEVRLGSLLEEGELLTTLSDNRKVWVYFNLTEAEYLAYKARESSEPLHVKLRMANGQMFPADGIVETIEADFNNETGNIAFRATFSNPDGLLRHGETGNVLIDTPLHDVVLVPQKATFDILDKKYVFTVDEKDVVHQREIQVSQELPHLFVVSGGIDEKDRVLLDGLRKVRDGDSVEVKDEEAKAVFDSLDKIHAE